MPIPTRWIKVFKDIWSNKTRTLLVILSIAVGIFAIGMTTNGARIVQRDMNEPYWATNPSSTRLFITPFDKDLAPAVESMREVAQAEARRVESFDIATGDNEWLETTIYAMPDYNNIRVNQFTLEAGLPDPGPRGILLERMTADEIGVSIGDTVTVKLPSVERRYELAVTGIIHDMHVMPPWFLNRGTAYVSMDTLQWMDLGWYYNSLEIIVSENHQDKQHIMQVAGLARDRVIEPSGYQVVSIEPFLGVGNPGDHPATADIAGMILIVNVIGVMCIFLTVGLVVNTLSALIVRQVQQIGIIRSIGGQRRQILWMYVSNVVLLSLCALAIAIPLGTLGAGGMAQLVGEMLNFDITDVNLPLSIFLLQVFVGLFVPLGAALFPILGGTNITVYDAIYQSGLIGRLSMGFIERLLKRLRGLTTTLILSIRNTFRRKARLAFTLSTLMLAGATFMAALSTYTSLMAKLESIRPYYLYDALIEMPGGVNRYMAEREALRIPEVSTAEGWYQTSATFVYDDETESEGVEVMAVPYEPVTMEPQLIAGRWLQEGDTNAIVINEDTLDRVSNIGVGSEVTLKINGIDRHYRVVGIVSRHIFGARVYLPYEYFDKTYALNSEVNVIRVRSQPGTFGDERFQTALALQLERRYKNANLGEGTSDTQIRVLSMSENGFQVILTILMVLSVLLAAVGGLGLTGAMSLNVLERTREIGVLRAVGASNGSVRKLVLVEGLFVGLMSWLLGTLVSFPFGIGLANAVSVATMQTTLAFKFSTPSMAIWLALVLIISTLASLVPAQNASQLTVREVLAYE
ncbi:MAG: ABC transporter permease [Anaerolineae bacterium]|nr:ABC transporter permease [Anaerolineae bacterium]